MQKMCWSMYYCEAEHYTCKAMQFPTMTKKLIGEARIKPN